MGTKMMIMSLRIILLRTRKMIRKITKKVVMISPKNPPLPLLILVRVKKMTTNRRKQKVH